ncbi:Uncharacterised protein [Burkholderia pseudomallei]|nr:Uncharacterised protein [Burkholderia pseudomallei]
MTHEKARVLSLAGFIWAHLAPDIVNIAKRGAVYNPFFITTSSVGNHAGWCSFSHSRNASFMRVCQPSPVALKASTMSTS